MKEEIIKSFFENIEKFFKYISFGIFLSCIIIGSLVIYHFNVQNIYLIISIYSGSILLGTILKKILDRLNTKYISHKMMSKSFLKKQWEKLSDEEKKILVESYNDDKCIYLPLENRTILLLQSKNMVYRPAQYMPLGGNATYILQPWTVKMIEINTKK